MEKILSKLALVMTSAAMALGVGVAAFSNTYKEVRADSYTSTFTASEVPENGGTVLASTTDPAEATYTWTTDDGTYIAFDNGGIHTGSGSKNCSFQRFASASFNEALISSVVVNAKSNGSDPTVSVSIDGHSLGSNPLTSSYDDYNFSNTVSNYIGNVVVDLSMSSQKKNIYTSSIIVTYTLLNPKSITSLSAELIDSEHVYYATESVATSDIKLVVTYDDSSSDTITNGNGLTITSGNPLVSGENTIGISFTNAYGTETTSLVIKAQPEKVLDHYSIGGDLTKKNYYDGDDWDLSGLVLNAHYTSGLNELDPVEIGSVVDLHTAGDLTYTLSPTTALFGTRKLNIGAIQYLSTDVASVIINGIQVKEQKKFVKYTSATLEDGNYSLVYNGKAMNNIDCYTSSPNRRLDAIDVTINASKLIAPTDDIIFKITQVDDVNHYYTIQDASDKYVIHNGSGSNNYIAMKTITGDPTSIAEWTVEYDNVNETYEFVNVGYSSYKIKYNDASGGFFATYTSPGKLELYKEPVPYVKLESEKYDLGLGDEITVTATPINGATGIATIVVDDDSLINFTDNGDNTATISVKNGILNSGEVVVTATLNESSVSILLNISNAVELSSIAIKTSPKLNYVTGEDIDLSGLEVEATFSDAHKEDVTSSVEITDTSSIDTSIKGVHEVTVSYTYQELTRTTSFTITFSYPSITVGEAIAIIKPLEKQTPTAETYRVTGKVVDMEWNGNSTAGYANINIAAKYNEQDPEKIFQIYHALQGDKDTFNLIQVGAGIVVESKLQKFVKNSQDIYETTTNPEIVDFDLVVDKLVQTIFVKDKNKPQKTQYYVGDDVFDYSGLAVTVRYNNGDDDDLIKYDDNPSLFLETFEITNPDTSVAKAYAPVIITHKATGFTCSFNVSVSDVKVSSIKVTTNPTKTEYASGEEFDPTGIAVTLVYNNGKEEPLADYTLLSYRTPSQDGKVYEGDTNVTVIYNNNNNITAKIAITVAEKYVLNITASISEGWNDDTYDIGGTFNTRSLVILVNYNDGTFDKYTNKNSDFSLFNIETPDMSTGGDKEVKITLKGTSHSTTVTIHVKGIEELYIDHLPYRTTYRVGDELDFNGLELSALYNNSDVEEVSPTWDSVTITGDTSVDGPDQDITFTYKGKSASYQIDVWMTDEGMETLISSEITKLRANYLEDEYTSENWVKVKKIIDDTEDVLSEFDPRNEGEHYSSDVMSWINDAIEEINKIPVKSLDKITISGPTKTSYVIGEKLDISGLVVTAHYEDGSTKTIESGKYSLSEVDMSTTGEKTIIVTYGNKSASFTITVNESAQPLEKTLESISLSGAIKNSYVVGEELDTSGLVVTATYSDQSSAKVTGWTVSGYDKNVIGEQTVTISYTEGTVTKTVTFTVTVNEKEVDPKVEETREAAIGEYLDFFDSIDLSGYSEEVIAQFNALKTEALAALGNAATEEEIATILANAKAALNSLLEANPKVTPTNNTNLGLILGLSIGGGALLVAGAVGLVLFLKKKKKVA